MSRLPATTTASATPPADGPPRYSEAHELIAVILLSLVAVLTAWCGFESNKWGGDSSVAFSEASAARIEAADYDSQARDARGFDLAVYSQWVLAEANGDTELADYIEARFSEQFAAAFDAWMADGQEERGPFQRPEYVPPGTEKAAAAKERADAKQAEALDFNEKGDNYSLMTVMFALVLFLAAIAQRGISPLATRIILGLAGGLALVGLVVLLTFPVRV
ncbi:hypothetical protein ACLQ2Q_14320 [Microbacterium sp. DT81.1]|uniref:hypothetical protein n=1 Tax=Microbacterium sp. DT81.1 TaxID=3393413 RepID=UPI003CEB79CE